MRHLPLALLALASVLPACADDGEVDGNVSKGWRATGMAVADQQDDWKTGVDAEGNLSVSADCVDGGHATVEGSYDGENDFDVSITFDGCTADDVVISGSLQMHASVETTDHSTDVSIDYGGELHWTGAAEGSCTVDMSASLSTSVTGTGNNTKIDVDAEFHGDVCGYDADAVASASAELG